MPEWNLLAGCLAVWTFLNVFLVAWAVGSGWIDQADR